MSCKYRVKYTVSWIQVLCFYSEYRSNFYPLLKLVCKRLILCLLYVSCSNLFFYFNTLLVIISDVYVVSLILKKFNSVHWVVPRKWVLFAFIYRWVSERVLTTLVQIWLIALHFFGVLDRFLLPSLFDTIYVCYLVMSYYFS